MPLPCKGHAPLADRVAERSAYPSLRKGTGRGCQLMRDEKASGRTCPHRRVPCSGVSMAWYMVYERPSANRMRCSTSVRSASLNLTGWSSRRYWPHPKLGMMPVLPATLIAPSASAWQIIGRYVHDFTTILRSLYRSFMTSITAPVILHTACGRGSS